MAAIRLQHFGLPLNVEKSKPFLKFESEYKPPVFSNRLIQKIEGVRFMKQTPIVWFARFILAILIVGCNNDEQNSGSQPVINSITPAQVSIGQRNVDGQILGSNLNGVTSVTLGDGISVASFNAVSASEIRVNFTVSDTAAAGARTITVNTSAGSVTSTTAFSVSTNRAPRARFTVNPPSGSQATVFTFDASISIDPATVSAAKVVGFQWNYGDGKTGTGKKSTHKFGALGKHTVTLTVTDGEATDFATREVEVKRNASPVPRFSILPGNGSTLTLFRFDGSRSVDIDGRIVDYRWDFGDGKRAKGEDVEHTYNKAGDYDVELAVVDNRGEIGRTEKEVKVEKAQGRVCNPRSPSGFIAYPATVEGWEGSTRTLTVRFQGNPGCSAYWRCGDVRKGGLRGWGQLFPEKWAGVMCSFIDLGDGRARIRLVLGNYSPSIGDKVYTWPQTDCTTRVCGGIR